MENKYLHTKRIVVLLSLLPPYTGDISHHSPRWEIAGCKASTERKRDEILVFLDGKNEGYWSVLMSGLRRRGSCCGWRMVIRK
ncbi:hypothetical protein NC652_030145 [Populus alba x Populus x berolinensis]|nr:hypothetical protein NC652_030145 [Populus alba x Populus x berolinensis]